MKTITRLLSILSTLLCFLGGCSTHTQGSYADPGQQEILGEQWNESDAQIVAKRAVEECLKARWMLNYRGKNKGKKPIIIVSHVANKTSEHIDTKAIVDHIRTELINSGQVRFLANEKRDVILEEYKYQNSGATRSDQAKGPGNQLGADFLLVGALTAITSEEGDYKNVTYQTNLQMTNLETSEYEWAFQTKVKKKFKRNSVTW